MGWLPESVQELLVATLTVLWLIMIAWIASGQAGDWIGESTKGHGMVSDVDQGPLPADPDVGAGTSTDGPEPMPAEEDAK